MSAKVTIQCDGILCDSEYSLEIGDWSGDFESEGNGHYIYCSHPDCQAQDEFFGAQCSGCVEGFGDCQLGKAFLFSYRRTLTEKQLRVIEAGVCPLRTNGTLGMRVTAAGIAVEDLDLSERAPEGSGKIVADVIRRYIAKYPAAKY
jgi:hypothetical protein